MKVSVEVVGCFADKENAWSKHDSRWNLQKGVDLTFHAPDLPVPVDLPLPLLQLPQALGMHKSLSNFITSGLQLHQQLHIPAYPADSSQKLESP